VKLRVNGVWRELPEAARTKTLLAVLRDDLQLTGTKQGCTVGVCGLCSVLVDGQLVSGCLTLAAASEDASISTIEGLDRPELEQAFVGHAGLQCGICTPGQIVAATALLEETPHPSTDEIRHWMTGNLCRCTGYAGILESIEAAASQQPAQTSDRLDAPDKASGTARYTNDLVRPHMLFGQVLRSPYPHARIVSIDASRARAVHGVHAVLVGADIPPDVRVGRNMRDMPVLARDKVRFVGEKVAAIAAESREVAEQALRLIDVEYVELPAVFDPIQAMQPGAPLIHSPDDVRTWAVRDQVVPDYPNGASAPAYGVTRTEIEAALADARHVFEHTFRTSMQHQAYLEPHSCVVEVDQGGVAHIWAAQKAPLLLARYLREGLGLTREQLDIHLMPLGGDFGGKGSFMDIPLAYFLARASARPVKMAMSYVDELTAGNPRHAATIVVRSGVDRDGRLLARWVRGYFASGGYAAFKPSTDTTLPGFRRGALGPYAVPKFRAECHMIYTNSVPCGHMRSPGEAQVAYAIEAHTDLVARALGVDPVAFRALNATRHPRAVDTTYSVHRVRGADAGESAAVEGPETSAADRLSRAAKNLEFSAGGPSSPADERLLTSARDVRPRAIDVPEAPAAGVPARAVEVLQAAAHAIGWHQPRPPRIGRGVALIEFSTSPGIYAGILRLARDGQLTIQTPIVEQGAGMLTVFRRIVADELGVPIQRVGVEQSLDDIEDDRGVGGSRTTRLVGKLLIELSRRVQQRLAELVAAEFGASATDVRVVPGGFGLSQPERVVSFDAAAALLDATLSESIVFRATEQDRSTVFLAQAAEVCVDRETGEVRPSRIVSVQEVGRVVDPLLARRQMEGAVLQGLGYALMEQLVLQDGRVQNQNLHEYKLPTQADVPIVETLMLAHDERLGLTPIGEAAVAGVAPAIVNAVVDVLGPRTFDLPLSPEKLLANISTG
jgi:CO/xanthine dehydrogenase Mo-binding subunit/aerobic-type carbon monoxide dehydrogenase small subunit (CoxS/CutS family)